MTADGGVPLAQSVDGAGAGFVDGPDSEGQDPAPAAAIGTDGGDAAAPEGEPTGEPDAGPSSVPEDGTDGQGDAALEGEADDGLDEDGTALAMSGSSGPVIINPSSSIRNVR